MNKRKFLAILVAAALIFAGASHVALKGFMKPAQAQVAGGVVLPCTASGSYSVNVTISAGNNYFYCPLYSAGGGTVTMAFVNSAGAIAPLNSTTVFIVYLQGASGTTTVTQPSNAGTQTVTATSGVATTIEYFYDPTTAHWYDIKLTT